MSCDKYGKMLSEEWKMCSWCCCRRLCYTCRHCFTLSHCVRYFCLMLVLL